MEKQQRCEASSIPSHFKKKSNVKHQTYNFENYVKFSVIRQESLPYLHQSCHSDKNSIEFKSFRYNRRIGRSSQPLHNLPIQKQNKPISMTSIIRYEHGNIQKTSKVNQNTYKANQSANTGYLYAQKPLFPGVSKVGSTRQNDQHSPSSLRNVIHNKDELFRLRLIKMKNKYFVEKMKRQRQQHNFKLSSIIEYASKDLLQKQNEMLESMI